MEKSTFKGYLHKLLFFRHKLQERRFLWKMPWKYCTKIEYFICSCCYSPVEKAGGGKAVLRKDFFHFVWGMGIRTFRTNQSISI